MFCAFIAVLFCCVDLYFGMQCSRRHFCGRPNRQHYWFCLSVCLVQASNLKTKRRRKLVWLLLSAGVTGVSFSKMVQASTLCCCMRTAAKYVGTWSTYSSTLFRFSLHCLGLDFLYDYGLQLQTV